MTKTETKSEQLKKAIAEAIEAVKPRRGLLYKYYKQYLYSGEPTLESEITASFFAQEIVTLEAKSACACYLAFRKIYAGEIRSSSSKLKPVYEALKAAAHSTLPSFWEDVPEIEECWEEYYMQGCPVCHLGSYYGRRIIDLRRI